MCNLSGRDVFSDRNRFFISLIAFPGFPGNIALNERIGGQQPFPGRQPQRELRPGRRSRASGLERFFINLDHEKGGISRPSNLARISILDEEK
jgi:hypothetical protein